jgi:hypothetical protein
VSAGESPGIALGNGLIRILEMLPRMHGDGPPK